MFCQAGLDISRGTMESPVKAFVQEMAKDPEVEGSRSYQSSATPLQGYMRAPKILVMLCFGAIRQDDLCLIPADFLNP